MRLFSILLIVSILIIFCECVIKSEASQQFQLMNIGEISKKIDDNPEDLELRYTRALLFEANGDYEYAIDDISYLLQTDYDQCELETKLSLLYFYSGDDEKSKYYFQQALIHENEAVHEENIDGL
jgi:tetratricopeptide (TPR) repeat protein